MLLSTIRFHCSIIGISETWLTTKSPNLFALKGYREIRKDRLHGRGGGLLMYISDYLTFKPRNVLSFLSETAESLCVEVDIPRAKNFIVCVVYRPPSSDVVRFLDDLESLMSIVNFSDKSVCVMGDFNIDLLSNNANSIRLQTILDSNAFTAMIDKPTRISDHSSSLLDNIFVKNANGLSQSGLLYSEISDHLPIFCILNAYQPCISHKRSHDMKRKITDEKVACLNADLNSEDWEDVLGCHDVEKAFELFWNKLYCYFDKHIPYSKSIDRKKGSTLGLLLVYSNL